MNNNNNNKLQTTCKRQRDTTETLLSFFFANLQKIFLLYIYASHSVQARVTSYGLGSPLGI